MRQLYPRQWWTDINRVMRCMSPTAAGRVRREGRSTPGSRALFIGAAMRILEKPAEYAVRLMEEADRVGLYESPRWTGGQDE